jgi:hypothetical protein
MPVFALTDVHDTVSRAVDIATADVADRSPDRTERMVRVDPISTFNTLFSVFSSSFHDLSEKVAGFESVTDVDRTLVLPYLAQTRQSQRIVLRQTITAENAVQSDRRLMAAHRRRQGRGRQLPEALGAAPIWTLGSQVVEPPWSSRIWVRPRPRFLDCAGRMWAEQEDMYMFLAALALRNLVLLHVFHVGTQKDGTYSKLETFFPTPACYLLVSLGWKRVRTPSGATTIWPLLPTTSPPLRPRASGGHPCNRWL